MRLFCDMDDVLTDFGPYLLEWNNVVVPQIDRWDIERSLNCTRKRMWEIVNNLPLEFWTSMPKTSWFGDLVELLEDTEIDWRVLTRPCGSQVCHAGKWQWLQDNFGYPFQRYIFTPDKTPLANHDHILIDDKEEVCDRFRQAGGRAILFPRPWNANWKQADNPLAKVTEMLSKYTGKELQHA